MESGLVQVDGMGVHRQVDQAPDLRRSQPWFLRDRGSERQAVKQQPLWIPLRVKLFTEGQISYLRHLVFRECRHHSQARWQEAGVRSRERPRHLELHELANDDRAT